MIRLARVSKDFAPFRSSAESGSETVHALRDVSLDVEEGQFVAVVGPSGCGKSTLLHITGGLETPSSGEVWVCGQPIHQMDERALSLFRRQHVGVIFQFFNLLPQLTALENIALPLRLLQTPPSEADQRAAQLLEEVGLHRKTDRLPAELSGGEQQRVAIARALAHRPRVVLADEPTGNLDSITSATVLSVLKEMQRAYKTTLLLVTHSKDVARAAHQVVVMQDGRVISKSTESKD